MRLNDESKPANASDYKRLGKALSTDDVIP